MCITINHTLLFTRNWQVCHFIRKCEYLLTYSFVTINTINAYIFLNRPLTYGLACIEMIFACLFARFILASVPLFS